MVGLKYRGSYEFPHKYFFWAYSLSYLAYKISNLNKFLNFYLNIKDFLKIIMAFFQDNLLKF